ncbi:unnamed protein product [Cylicocyclus nassatus]|uniref:BAAT/acyl-CoA thioester hydrolase protein n=1 Tax=Cylicocyclus nassatus TaxID=53992 RepID=A0AA36MHM9_CYLNA|nr:unnamed protein product [Cylicocyclus nassatus]
MLHIDKIDTLMKEPLSIAASALTSGEIYEVLLRLNHPLGTYKSNGFFRADHQGKIDLTNTAPLRGTYCDLRPMGLFESLQPCEDVRFGSYCKCTPPNPFKFVVELRNCTGQLLCSLPLIKRWVHPSVLRKEIDEDGICGTLFIPPGEGPFPTILDMSGTGGGINEHKGASLASEGFCVLSLAFFQYKTLISDLNDLDLDYFSKAIHWLIALPFTSNEIGVQGNSFGGLLANMLAVRIPEIVAVCSINGSHAISETVKIKEHGKRLPYAAIPIEKIYFINEAMCYDKAIQHMKVTEETDIKIETAPSRTAFRLVASIDDLSTSTVFVTRYLERKLRESNHYVEVDMVPGGHLMEPPYFPAHGVVYAKFADSIQAYGGEPCMHGARQDQVWSNTVVFFKRFLGNPQPLADYRTQTFGRSHL